MLSAEQQNVRTRRKEIMKELEELNQGNKVFDIATRMQRHEEIIKQIEGRVAGFFKKGEFNQNAFDYYLFELGDLTKVDRIYGTRTLSIYDNTGIKIDDFQYTFTNIYVEYAKKLVKRIYWEFKNRVGVKELGHYQRNVRKGIKELENVKIGAADRERILLLYPSLMYNNKLDIQQIADIWGTQRAGAVKNMKKLTSEENGKIMVESKDGKKKVYSFNHKYLFSGKGGRKGNYEVKVYINLLSEVIKKVKEIEKQLAIELDVKELKHSALATLHAIIPYFHYETCYAVKNPTISICRVGETVEEAIQREVKEDTESPLEFLNITQIASIVAKGETDLNYIKRDLYTLERVGAILYTTNTILINPKLMWAMNDEFNNENNLYVKEILYRFKVEKDARKKQRNDEKKFRMVKKKSSAKTLIEK